MTGIKVIPDGDHVIIRAEGESPREPTAAAIRLPVEDWNNFATSIITGSFRFTDPAGEDREELAAMDDEEAALRIAVQARRAHTRHVTG